MRTLVINSSNYVAGSGNTYTYYFPSSYSVKDGDQIGVANISIAIQFHIQYYSSPRKQHTASQMVEWYYIHTHSFGRLLWFVRLELCSPTVLYNKQPILLDKQWKLCLFSGNRSEHTSLRPSNQLVLHSYLC